MTALTFGERLALVRKRRELTQQQLAERVGCQQTDIHRMEAGLVRDPHMSRLVALALALQVSTDALAGLRDITEEVAVPPKTAKRLRSRKAAPVA